MVYAGRVSVDIDDYEDAWKLRAVRVWHALERHADDVEAHISSSGSGIHVVGYFDERALDEETRLEIRRTLGDDGNRIQMDKERGAHGHTTGVMWDQKSRNGTGTKDRDFVDVYDAIRHIEAQNDTDHDRMRRLVNDGIRAV